MALRRPFRAESENTEEPSNSPGRSRLRVSVLALAMFSAGLAAGPLTGLTASSDPPAAEVDGRLNALRPGTHRMRRTEEPSASTLLHAREAPHPEVLRAETLRPPWTDANLTASGARFAVTIPVRIKSRLEEKGVRYKMEKGVVYGHLLTFIHAWREKNDDLNTTDIVIWLYDASNSTATPRQLMGGDYWRIFQRIPGVAFVGGGLCSEFGKMTSESTFRTHDGKDHSAKMLLDGYLLKMRSSGLIQYDRVLHMDWDTIPGKPGKEFWNYDMRGKKVVAQQDAMGPFFGGQILIKPVFKDYEAICRILISHGDSKFDHGSGWENVGEFYSPLCCTGCSFKNGTRALWQNCDPAEKMNYFFHGADLDQGLFLHYYGIQNNWLQIVGNSFGPRQNGTRQRHLFLDFGHENSADFTVTEKSAKTPFGDYLHFKGSSKLTHGFLKSKIWRKLYQQVYQLNKPLMEKTRDLRRINGFINFFEREGTIPVGAPPCLHTSIACGPQ